MTRFADMLDRKGEEIKQPPLLPVGTYLVMGKKHPEIGDVKGRDGTMYEKITCELAVVEAVEVDPDALTEFGNYKGYTVRKQFLFDTSPEADVARERTLNSMKMFFATCGLDVDNMTMKEMLAGFPTAQCQAEITHRPDANDAERFYLEVGRTYAA